MASPGGARAPGTGFRDDGPTFTLKWPPIFVLGVILVLGSML